MAIVGRPNVGKSTLFNRLVGRRRAIVHDLPGVTRDRIVETAKLDDDSAIDLIDTGGLVPEREDPLGLGAQVMLAIDESDVLLLVVDGRTGPVPGDEEVLAALRRRNKPILLVVNKADVQRGARGSGGVSPARARADPDLGRARHRHRGAARPHPRAAPSEEPPAEDAAGPTIAIVGRPNVGKSSLLNRIVGAERVLVSAEPGTTRDPIDTVVEWDGKPFVLVDTAGIRRRAKVSGAPEDLAVMMAQRQIERAQAALLLIDAAQGVTSGDLAIAGVIHERARACVVVCNKWDLLAGDEEARERLERGFDRLDELLAGPPRVNVSASTGRAVDRIFPQRRPCPRGLQPPDRDQPAQRRARARDGAPPSAGGRRQAMEGLLRLAGGDGAADLHAVRHQEPAAARAACAGSSRTSCVASWSSRAFPSGW